MASVEVENAPKNGNTEEQEVIGEKLSSKRTSDDMDETGDKLAVKRGSEEIAEDASSKKIKLDDTEPPNELEKKIIRQIEYYFGDFNLGRDKFMLSKIAEDNGWIPISVLLTFKRLASLTTDPKIIILALTKSDTQLVQVSEDCTKLRRALEYPIPELNEERRKELMSRTAYVKGFPLHAEFDDILKWFEDIPNIASVNKRSYLDKATKQFMFKGSVFVIFKTVEDCKKFIESEKPYHYDTEKSELIVKWQQKYIEEKRKEHKEEKEINSKLKMQNAKKFEHKTIEDCSIVHLSGLNKETVRDDIKAQILEKYEVEVCFVEHTKGEAEAHIRLQSSDGTKLMEKSKDGKLEINETEVVCRLLEGDELKEHVEKIKSNILSSRRKRGSHKGRKNRQGKRK